MSYLLIILVIFVALAPLLSMRPSRRQRELADLRQAASSAGLYVELLPREPAAAGARSVSAGPAGSSAPVAAGTYYGCRRQRGDKPVAGSVRYQRDGNEWRAEVGNWPPERLELLQQLPASVTEIDESVLGVGVVWNEHGAREDVENIARVLRRLLGRKH